MMRTDDARLEQHPEPVDGLRVDISAYVDLGRMVDDLVVKTPLPEPVVQPGVIGIDDGRGDTGDIS